MTTLASHINGIAAACSVDAAAAPAFFAQRGFTATGLLRNGAGDYSLTLLLANNLQTECVVLNGLAGAVGNAMIAMEVISTTVIRVRTFTSGGAGADVAADIDFWVAVLRLFVAN